MLVLAFLFGLVTVISFLWTSCRKTVTLPLGVASPGKVPGLPILGNVIDLHLHGCSFISSCFRRYKGGHDAFSLNLLGQKMTFLLSPSLLPMYFKTKNLSFAPAVQQFTNRVFGIPSSVFFCRHSLMLCTLKEILSNSEHHGQRLQHRLSHYFKILPVWNHETVELFQAMSTLVFRSGVDTLFGESFLQRHGADRVQEMFFAFESGFELAASPLPHCLQPAFRRARRWLLQAIQVSCANADFDGTAVGNLLKTCDIPHKYMPHLLLCVLWASQANTVPATFWSLSFLLQDEHKNHLSRIESLLLSNECEFDRVAWSCRDDTFLARCCSEAVRLTSHSIDVRIAQEDFVAGELFIAKGSVVAISPYDSHRDERLYGTNATSFDPEREGWGQLHAHGVAGIGGLTGIAFGGGFYRCPGRRFATMEMSLVISTVLHRYEVKRAPFSRGLPDVDMSRLVGVKLPKESFYVTLRRRVHE